MYIVLEGIVGSGKSTQTERLVAFLRSHFPEREFLTVREPGSTPIAEDIRLLAQAKEWETETMDPLTNAYLYAGARAQLIKTVIEPAQKEGKIVIADRSFVSSLAYQGKAQGLGIETILDLNMPIIEHCIPDLILTLDLPLEVALARMFDATGDKWEKMNKPFFEKVIEGYRCASTLPFIRDRFHWVDATGDRDHVESRIRAIVLGRISCYTKHP